MVLGFSTTVQTIIILNILNYHFFFAGYEWIISSSTGIISYYACVRDFDIILCCEGRGSRIDWSEVGGGFGFGKFCEYGLSLSIRSIMGSSG